ncbi:MAG: prepilin peptidase [Geodermatophilaceae bacterium]|nr:prepilin peptidase [Geodermatophilaceae bacterium]
MGAATAAVFAVLAAAVGAEPALAAFLFQGAVGVVLAVIDTEHHRLPDRVVLPAYGVGASLLLAAALLTGDIEVWLRAVVAAAAVFAGFFVLALINPEGFGFGDVKLGGLLGLYLGWLGWGYVVLGVVAAFVLGSAFALVLIALRRASARTPVPFGPALLAGAFLAVVSGPEVLAAYGG